MLNVHVACAAYKYRRVDLVVVRRHITRRTPVARSSSRRQIAAYIMILFCMLLQVLSNLLYRPRRGDSIVRKRARLNRRDDEASHTTRPPYYLAI